MDSTSRIWEVNTGKLVNTIELDVPIRCLAVSEGDKYLCLCTLPFAGEAVFPLLLYHIAYYLFIQHGRRCPEHP